MSDPISRVTAIFDDHLAAAQRTRATLMATVADLGADLCAALDRGGKLVVFGNGGSAADAQHFAAELTGHFLSDRGPLPAIALTVDTSALTAIANDYSYADVFARQASALCGPDDLVVVISTSGRAESVIRGAEAARTRGARTWALTGGTGGRLAEIADRSLVVPSAETARIQEMHITAIHAVCALIDDWELARRTTSGEGFGPPSCP
jgi:D-sedoheptulose 7-phosphate isomerase